MCIVNKKKDLRQLLLILFIIDFTIFAMNHCICLLQLPVEVTRVIFRAVTKAQGPQISPGYDEYDHWLLS